MSAFKNAIVSLTNWFNAELSHKDKFWIYALNV